MATTEPVADYLLTAMGMDNLTPFGFQADIMNGVDPTPQDITLEDGFFTKHTGEGVLLQPAGRRLPDHRRSARPPSRPGSPWSGVYETMPTPGYDFQSWMLAEVNAIEKAVTTGTSTEQL